MFTRSPLPARRFCCRLPRRTHARMRLPYRVSASSHIAGGLTCSYEVLRGLCTHTELAVCFKAREHYLYTLLNYYYDCCCCGLYTLVEDEWILFVYTRSWFKLSAFRIGLTNNPTSRRSVVEYVDRFPWITNLTWRSVLL